MLRTFKGSLYWVTVFFLPFLTVTAGDQPSNDYGPAPPPVARATQAPPSWNDLQLRQESSLSDGNNALEERQVTLTAGARPTPIYIPFADPKVHYEACFWGVGNAGQSVYKVFETASNGNQWQAYLLEGPMGASLYHDQLTTEVNGTLETVIASATCKYDAPIENNVAVADCNWMAVINPPATSWYSYRAEITATYTPGVCDLQLVKNKTWNIGSGNGTFDTDPDTVPGSWAARHMQHWAESGIWLLAIIGLLSVIGLGVL
ncbi:hypothetical protein OC846_001480 [Tilletia horrida]|uniref:Uncharacterized protein n=1 Tax=Tilletia horrida TaxID=155126 RepID=A0AAN6JZT1_9BASI|nr:hypothetical protein OC845_006325 [Tilletia horrida]KAK0555928.1 hypothetical protein OC846_001480 [Tilletia horrida]KAK0560103.1 hypothetical protein OC861_006410 [Tilletia horrida]